MALRAVVVDDEELARARLCELVAANPSLELVGEASDGARALDVLGQLEPELVFLDIQMPELDGFQVLAALDADALPAVVFVTAFDAYAIQAFDVGALDYLLKPITQGRFDEAVGRVVGRLSPREQSLRARELALRMDRERGFVRRLVARRGSKHYFVPVPDIDWIESDGNYLRVHAGGKTHLVRRTMKDLEERMDPDHFVRIHRSTLVAIDRIASVQASDQGEYVVTMADGQRLPSSRSYSARVRRLLR
jgi:two-component system, LytTR family, response regulator